MKARNSQHRPTTANVGQQRRTLPSPPYSGRTPPESGEFSGTQIRRETVLSKYFSHAFQHQITPEYQQNITVLPPDSHRNLMKTSVQHRTPTGLCQTLVSSVGLRLAEKQYYRNMFPTPLESPVQYSLLLFN